LKKHFIYFILYTLTLSTHLDASQVKIPKEFFDLYKEAQRVAPTAFEVLTDYEKSPERKFSPKEILSLPDLPLRSIIVDNTKPRKTVSVSKAEHHEIQNALQFISRVDRCVEIDPQIGTLINQRLECAV
jgi:hypothetical protein